MLGMEKGDRAATQIDSVSHEGLKEPVGEGGFGGDQGCNLQKWQPSRR
jgi:hypothetical protein